MTQNEKYMLIALIDGLTKKKDVSQYDDGDKYLDQKAIEVLQETIQHM